MNVPIPMVSGLASFRGDFGDAVKALKAGERVGRKGWGLAYLSVCDATQTIMQTIVHPGLGGYPAEATRVWRVTDTIAHRDMLANDWGLYQPPTEEKTDDAGTPPAA